MAPDSHKGLASVPRRPRSVRSRSAADRIQHSLKYRYPAKSLVIVSWHWILPAADAFGVIWSAVDDPSGPDSTFVVTAGAVPAVAHALASSELVVLRSSLCFHASAMFVGELGASVFHPPCCVGPPGVLLVEEENACG